jgi:hypothetical protein
VTVEARERFGPVVTRPFGLLSRLAAQAVLLVLMAAVCAFPADAQALSGAADEVKAAYLYRFVGYIEWPDGAFTSAESPLVIGVAGSDPVHAELNRVLLGRSAHGRPLVVRKVVPGESLDGVHVLFVGDAGLARSPWLQRHRDRPLLIVTDAAQGLDAGAGLNFVLVDDRLRFEASMRAIERAGLKVSSRLLALAQRVVGP